MYSLKADTYANKKAFEKVRTEWKGTDYTTFSKSLEPHLTFKFKAQKYAVSFALCAVIMLLLIKQKIRLKSASKQSVIILGFVSSALSLVAFWLNNYWLQIHDLLPIEETAMLVFKDKIKWFLYFIWVG